MVEICFEKSDKVQVFIDDRELKSACARRLFDLEAVLKPVRLPVGDYVLSDRAVIERKTTADFETSIIDGRLFGQAKELVDNFSSPIIAVTGSGFERIQQKALQGAFISLAVDYKIPLFFFDDDEKLADFVFALGFREQLLAPREMKLQFDKRASSLADQQQIIVESLPLIGPKNAKAMLKHFGSIEKLVNASEEELQEVDGIAEKRAKEIKRVLKEKYSP